MAQRKSMTETTIESLLEETRDILPDADALAAKAANLAKLPTPKYVEAIPISQTRSNREQNTRDEVAYRKEGNENLYASIRENGLVPGTGSTMVWSLRRDGFHYPLVGNLRHFISGLVNQDTLQECERRNQIHLANGEPLEEYKQPITHVFGLVYEGLTEDQEFALVADHLGTRELNDSEKAREIGEFKLRTGRADADLAKWFGQKPSTIQRLCMRYMMSPVFEQYRKEKVKPTGALGPFMPVSQKALTKLYSAYLLDQKAGGLKPRETGDNFNMIWQVMLADPKAFDRPVAKAKVKDRDTITSQIGALEAAYGSTVEVKAVQDVLRWAAETPDANGDIPGLQTAIKNLQQEILTLRRRASDAEMRFEQVLDERDKVILELAEFQKEFDAFKADAVKDFDSLNVTVAELTSANLALTTANETLTTELTTAKTNNNGKMKANK